MKTKFKNGGFGIHNDLSVMPGYRVSAWYDRDGHLIDCKAVCIWSGRGRYIKPNGPTHRRLVSISKSWKHAQ